MKAGILYRVNAQAGRVIQISDIPEYNVYWPVYLNRSPIRDLRMLSEYVNCRRQEKYKN